MNELRSHTGSGSIPLYPNEAAFPRPATKRVSDEERRSTLLPEQWGLTKRELLAAMAMQGWLAGCGNAYDEFTGLARNASVAAECCVKFADALLVELSK